MLQSTLPRIKTLTDTASSDDASLVIYFKLRLCELPRSSRTRINKSAPRIELASPSDLKDVDEDEIFVMKGNANVLTGFVWHTLE